VPAAIAPILVDGRDEIPAAQATVAAFYSLSTCQEGLGGISFGSFLIKRVVDELSREFPDLKDFATLSPIPGFKAWLDDERAKQASPVIARAWRADLAVLDRPGWCLDGELADRPRDALVALLAYYLLSLKDAFGKPFDPVARLHLRNGAKLERINWLADKSDKGMNQSAGMMVNYIYNVGDIEKNHELYANEDHLAASQAVTALLKKIPDMAQKPEPDHER
jgi:malonyl-CoA decarboxylase